MLLRLAPGLTAVEYSEEGRACVVTLEKAWKTAESSNRQAAFRDQDFSAIFWARRWSWHDSSPSAGDWILNDPPPPCRKEWHRRIHPHPRARSGILPPAALPPPPRANASNLRSPFSRPRRDQVSLARPAQKCDFSQAQPSAPRPHHMVPRPSAACGRIIYCHLFATPPRLTSLRISRFPPAQPPPLCSVGAGKSGAARHGPADLQLWCYHGSK